MTTSLIRLVQPIARARCAVRLGVSMTTSLIRLVQRKSVKEVPHTPSKVSMTTSLIRLVQPAYPNALRKLVVFQ